MAIEDVYRNVLGRAPTQAEVSHFKKFMDAGDLDEMEIGQILGSLPEAQQARNLAQGKEYESLLGQGDASMLAKSYGQAMGDFRRMGRPDSSGLASAYANASQNLALQRQNQLAQFYGQGMSNVGQNYMGLGQDAQSRGYGQRDDRTRFNRDLDLAKYWYTRQSNDYQDQLNAQNRANRTGAIAGLAGGVLGGVGGAFAGAPFGMTGPGARMGAGFGGQLGGIFR